MLVLAATMICGLGVAQAAAQSGTLEGRITLKQASSRFARAPYPTANPARQLEPLPAVAMLLGTVAGRSGDGARQLSVAQQDTAFEPSVLVVQRGSVVAFPNRDPFFHNVFSYSRAKRFDLGRYPRGESKSVTFDNAGVVKLFCEIHNWMRGAVLVAENPYHAVASPDGRFTISNVPPGRYRMLVWHFDRGERTVEVEVPASGTARIEVEL